MARTCLFWKTDCKNIGGVIIMKKEILIFKYAFIFLVISFSLIITEVSFAHDL